WCDAVDHQHTRDRFQEDGPGGRGGGRTPRRICCIRRRTPVSAPGGGLGRPRRGSALGGAVERPHLDGERGRLRLLAAPRERGRQVRYLDDEDPGDVLLAA